MLKRSQIPWLVLFLAPATVVVVVFIVAPLFASMFNSFFAWDGFVRQGFVGFENFVDIFRVYPYNEQFPNALKNNQIGGNLFFMRVYVDEDELVAEYSKFPRLPWYEDDDDEFPYDREVLATDVDHVEFLYAGQQDSVVIWVEEWDRENYDFIPLAVQMTVEWKNGTTEQWLRRTAASGGNSVYGAMQEIDE